LTDALEKALSLHHQGSLPDAARFYQEALRVDPTRFDALHGLGILRTQQGWHSEAVDMFRRALHQRPESAEAQYNLGIAFEALGQFWEAAARYNATLALRPDVFAAHNNLGNVLQALGRHEDAVAHYRRALALKPDLALAHNNLGNALYALKRREEALDHYRHAIALQPDYIEAHHALANALGDLERFDEAVGHYQDALRINPNWPVARYDLAYTLGRLGRQQEAEQQYREALRLKPDFAEAYNNLAQLLNREGGFEEAASLCREALRLQPNYAEAHNNLGDALGALGRFKEAEQCYREALRLRPNLATLHRNLGDALAGLHRGEEALECYRQALRLKPDMFDVLNSMGLTFCALGREDEAEPCFAEALRLMPEFMAARVNHCMARLRVVYRDEAEIERARSAYAAELKAVCGGDALPAPLTLQAIGGKRPFLLAYQGRCDRDLQAIYGAFVVRVMSALYPRWASPPEVKPPQPGEAIRVGILSKHFNLHSNWKIPIKGWLSGLDKRRFQVFGYHLDHREDSETAVARSLCHRFVQGLPTFAAWVEAIRADRLHVLLIPGIGMDAVTVRLAALRLAPVQATSWGHPETTGLPTIDDYLSSELMEPPGAEAHYTERLVRLPNLSISYEPLAVTPDTVARPELGITDDDVLFWCCQSLFKYLPRYDWVFARIAAAVPKARFLFIQYGQGDVTGTFRRRLAAVFAAAGLDAEQHCRFVSPMTMARFAGISRIADVFLDSLGWSGCNSTLEALAWDLPVVTMAGDLMRGRHSAAILTMLGMPELIAATPEAFVALAAELGRDPVRRRALSARIARDKRRLYVDKACIDGLARYLHDAAHAIQTSPLSTRI
jgi:protein O-GlcNAc transferase